MRAPRIFAALGLALVAPACGRTPSAGEIVAARTEELRPTEAGAQAPRFDATDVVETFESPAGEFLVHFVREGRNAVPPADGDASGVPDFVERVAATYEAALAKYLAAGFEHPVRDADGAFDVYLVDFGSGADGAYRSESCATSGVRQCAGYMLQDNDFAGYSAEAREEAIAVLASHEFFHAVQAAYDDTLPAVFSEGTAVWATEFFDETLTDLEGFAPAYFREPTRSLEQNASGPVDAFTYGSGVFFLYLAERFGDGLIPALLDDVKNGARGVEDPRWFDALDALLRRDHESSYADAVFTFAEWCLRTGRRADPSRSFARGASLPLLTSTRIALPFEDDRVRVLRSSIVPFVVNPDRRASLRAALRAPAGESLEGLRVVLATEVGGRIADVVSKDATDPDIAIETGDATQVHVLLVRARDMADSRTPAVCVGEGDEVAPCVAETAPEDAGVEGDATISAPPSSGSCAAAPGAATDATFPALAMALFGLVISRRRR